MLQCDAGSNSHFVRMIESEAQLPGGFARNDIDGARSQSIHKAQRSLQMKYDFISADCHVDLIWLPPDLFTANAPAALRDRMPYVTVGPRGREWVTRNGASFGLDVGM